MKIFDFSKVMYKVSSGKLVAQKGKLVIPTPINSTNCPTVYVGSVINRNVESDGKEYTVLDNTKKVPVCMSRETFYVKAGSWEGDKQFLGIRVYLGSGNFDSQKLFKEIPYSTGVEDSDGNLVFTYDFPVFEYGTAHFYYLAAYNSNSGEESQFLQNAYLTKKIVKTENGGVGPVPPEPEPSKVIHIGEHDYEYVTIGNYDIIKYNLHENIGTVNTDYVINPNDTDGTKYGYYYTSNKFNQINSLIQGWAIATDDIINSDTFKNSDFNLQLNGKYEGHTPDHWDYGFYDMNTATLWSKSNDYYITGCDENGNVIDWWNYSYAKHAAIRLYRVHQE